MVYIFVVGCLATRTFSTSPLTQSCLSECHDCIYIYTYTSLAAAVPVVSVSMTCPGVRCTYMYIVGFLEQMFIYTCILAPRI